MNRLRIAAAFGACIVLGSANVVAAPPPTAFVYQGSLASGGELVNGPLPTEFRLFDAASGGSQVGSVISRTTSFSGGLFSESLDFGAAAFGTNQALWLEIRVNGQTMGRTPLNAAPFALNTRGITVAANGSVGVQGVTNPKAALHVGGAIVTPERIGIGTLAPSNALDVFGSAFVSGQTTIGSGGAFEQDIHYRSSTGNWQVGTNGEGSGTSGNQFYIYDWSNNTYRLTVQRGTGRVGIGTTSPATMLDVGGSVTIRGGADLVEGFESACELAAEAGTVLVIDPDNPGKLMCSVEAYDMKVAGVVSGANGVQPGLKLGQDGVMDGDIPVAMTGRVYVKASAENGAIEPGDLLTTASIPGHAMKVTDHARGQGAVIGKAMTTLDEGEGLVLVLVNLQ